MNGIKLKVFQNIRTLKWYYAILEDGQLFFCSQQKYDNAEEAKRAALLNLECAFSPCDVMCEADDGVTTCATCKWNSDLEELKGKFMKEGVFDV